MRIFALLLALCLALAAPAMAEVKKAKTIDELAKMFDSTQCKSCHQEIYDQWAKSHHSRSLMGVKDGLMMTPLAMKGGTAFSPDEPSKATIKTFPCFKCHLPQALRFAEDSVAAEYAQALVDGKKEIVAKLNIGCMVCHNEKAIIHKLQEGMPVVGTVYGTVDNPAHAGGPIKKSSIMTHAIMCGQCHGLGPNLEFDNPVQCATLYGSYEHAYIPNGGTQQCQECHMPMVNGKADHLIAPNFNDHVVSKAMLDQALDFNMEAFAYEWLRKAKDSRPMIVVNTRIDNRAGHRVPDG